MTCIFRRGINNTFKDFLVLLLEMYRCSWSSVFIIMWFLWNIFLSFVWLKLIRPHKSMGWSFIITGLKKSLLLILQKAHLPLSSLFLKCCFATCLIYFSQFLSFCHMCCILNSGFRNIFQFTNFSPHLCQLEVNLSNILFY